MDKTDSEAVLTQTEATISTPDQGLPPAPVEKVVRKRNKEASKQKLLQAAIEVFSQRGYDAATTKEVARAAGVNEALIQKYFDGKAGLLLAVLTSFEGKEGSNICPNSPVGPDLSQDLAKHFERGITACAENRKMMRVAVSRAIVDERIADFLKGKMENVKVVGMTKRLAAFQEQGQIAKDTDLEAVAYTIMSLGFYFGFMAPVIYKMDQERIQKICSTAAGIIAKGLATPEKS